MADVYSNTYWQTEFIITQADLSRLENYISETGQAQDLTTLARRIIRGRLIFGEDVSPAAWGTQRISKSSSVRLWDPAGEWQIGDHVIVARPLRRDVYQAFGGEVIAIGLEDVKIVLDSIQTIVTYERAAPDSDQAREWRDTVREAVMAQGQTSELEGQIESILLQHGQRVTSQLLDAFRADQRFVLLNGRWFLRRLAALPSSIQLYSLAWAMLNLEEPQPTEALLPRIAPPGSPGDPGLFGLYLALRDQPHLFANADPGQRPRWVLAGPPPGPATARYAAYDPETYHVLCEPEEIVARDVAERLWTLELFRVICAPMDKS
ncbi:MAG: hypothetical protein BroJett011_18290 [Chloroflexota bacterium]|nr:MAG: hypothetical protein BroJett011_18290 [Chloroflexota bacterium]